MRHQHTSSSRASAFALYPTGHIRTGTSAARLLAAQLISVVAALATWMLHSTAVVSAPAASAMPMPAVGDTGAVCNEEAGDCFEANLTPGCNDPACCDLVCAELAFCCTFEWDAECAALALEICELPSVCPGEGSCFEPQEKPGCADEACCELMCAIDPFCCNLLWDELCALQAIDVCALLPCTLPAIDGFEEPEPCDERLNDGCNVPTLEGGPGFTTIQCGQTYLGTCFAGAPRDTDWYVVELDAPAEVNWTIQSEFPSQALIIEGGLTADSPPAGDCTDALRIIAEHYGGGCQPYTVSACLEPGAYALFIGPATSQGPVSAGAVCPADPDDPDPVEPGPYDIHYAATLHCTSCSPPCPADLTGDAQVDGGDLALLLGAWGECDGAGAGTGGCPADLNDDSIVDGGDLALLLGAWGTCPK